MVLAIVWAIVASVGFACAIAIALVASGAWASGGTEGAAAKKVTITHWAFPFADEAKDTAMFDQIKAEFVKTNPNITVNYEFFPWDARRERMQTALASGTGPDVVYLNDDMKPLYFGQFIDLYKYVKKEDLADFKPGTIEASSYKGVLCYLPILVNSVAIVFNMDVLDKLGYTKDWVNKKFLSWDDFTQYCDKAKAAGFWAYTMGPSKAGIVDELSSWVYQAGADYYNADVTKCTLDSPEAIRAFKYATALWEKGYINPADKDKDQNEVQQGVFPKGGVGAVMVQNQNIQNQILKNNPTMRLALAYVLKDKVPMSNGTIAGYGSFTVTKNPEAAVAWIMALTGSKGMELIDRAVNFIPTRFSVDSKFTEEMKDPLFARAVENTAWFKPTVPASPIGAAANNEIMIAYQKMILKQASVEDALKDCVAKINRLLDEYYKKTK